MSQHSIGQFFGLIIGPALRRSVARTMLATVLATVLALLACTRAAAAERAEPVQAIWKAQEIVFYFQSFTTFYSCTGLEDKLERILTELGANAKVKVRSADCARSVARMPRVTMEVVSPVEATPQALADRAKDKSTRELAARVQGKRAELAESLEQFPAQWRAVSMTRGELNLEPGDCELIEQLTRKVLPKLAVRIVKDDVQCSPHQLTLGQPRLEVEALIEMPKPDDAAGSGPDSGGRSGAADRKPR